MKHFLLLFGLLFLAVFSIAHTQEPLWRKGGRIPTKFDFANIFDRTKGLYHNDSAVFELSYNTLHLYDIKTGTETEKDISNIGMLIGYSPNCRFMITSKSDTMFSYNTAQENQVFIRKGIEEIIHYTNDNKYVLLNNGEVYNLETGTFISTVSKFNLTGVLHKSDSLIFARGQAQNTMEIINIITDTRRIIYGTPLTEGRVAISSDGKTMVQYKESTIVVLNLNKDTVTQFKDLTEKPYYISEAFFLDNEKLFLLNLAGYRLKYKIVDINNFTILKSDEFEYESKNTFFRETIAYPGYKNAVLVHLDGIDDCGGMPHVGASYRYVVVNPYSNKPISVFPDIVTPHDRSIVFTDENKSLSFISKQNTVETFNVDNGEKISSWSISPYYVSGFTQYADGNKVLARASDLIFQNENKLYLFSPKNGIVQDSIVFANDTIQYIKPTTDSKRIICPTKSGSVHIVDVVSFSIKTSVKLQTGLSSIVLNGDTLFYTTSGSNYVKKYSINSQQLFDSMFVAGGTKILGSEGTTYIPTSKIEITRLKDNIALKNISLGYQMGLHLYLSIAAIDNIPKYWKIREHLQAHGDDEGYAYLLTMQENGDTLIHQKKWTNKFRCYTNDIVFSDDGRYCATISNDAFEVHKVVGLINSVSENDNAQFHLTNSSYYLEGDVLTFNDGNEYNSSVLYTFAGENLGMCITTATEGVMNITIPHYIQNGFYSIVMHHSKGITTKRILLNR